MPTTLTMPIPFSLARRRRTTARPTTRAPSGALAALFVLVLVVGMLGSLAMMWFAPAELEVMLGDGRVAGALAQAGR